MADIAHANGAVLHRAVFEERVAQLAVFVLDALQHALHLGELRVIDVADHAAHLDDRENDASARGLLEDVEHALAQAPAVHEQALETECVGRESHPQHVGVDTRKLVPDDAQVLGALGDLDAHELLDGLGVAMECPNAQMPQIRSAT